MLVNNRRMVEKKKERRYFVTFDNEHCGILRCSTRTITVKGVFRINDVAKFLERENNCSNPVITFFKELKDYER